jgi:shikimate kinase
MSSAEQVCIIGLMGVGKSTVGRIVADRLHRRLVDSDTSIEQGTGHTVRELWESGGEAAYRALESSIVLDALDGDELVVIAAPAGVVLDPAVRAALGAPFVAWLRADPAVLAGRVRPHDHRPLLGDDPAATLRTMAVERAERYREVADATIDVDALAPSSAADRIVEAFTSRTAPPSSGSDTS